MSVFRAGPIVKNVVLKHATGSGTTLVLVRYFECFLYQDFTLHLIRFADVAQMLDNGLL